MCKNPTVRMILLELQWLLDYIIQSYQWLIQVLAILLICLDILNHHRKRYKFDWIYQFRILTHYHIKNSARLVLQQSTLLLSLPHQEFRSPCLQQSTLLLKMHFLTIQSVVIGATFFNLLVIAAPVPSGARADTVTARGLGEGLTKAGDEVAHAGGFLTAVDNDIKGAWAQSAATGPVTARGLEEGLTKAGDRELASTLPPSLLRSEILPRINEDPPPTYEQATGGGHRTQFEAGVNAGLIDPFAPVIPGQNTVWKDAMAYHNVKPFDRAISSGPNKNTHWIDAMNNGHFPFVPPR